MSETEQDKTIEEAILENASGPKSVEIDGQRVEKRSISELVEADEYLAKKKAGKVRGFGLKFAKMEHSGSA